MPLYEFQLNGGGVVEEFRPIAEAPKVGERVILNDGRSAVRIFSLSKDKPGPGEFWRKHSSPGLEVGKKQVAQMEQHYAKHGIHVSHRKANGGGYVPNVASQSDFNRLCEARGLKNKW